MGRCELPGVLPTSVAVAPNGTCALIACADGAVWLLSLEGAGQASMVGQLVARGLNNTLVVNVAIADDCRLGFASACKGATEMLAFDLSRGPANVRSFSHVDAKLRGLLACVPDKGSSYVLACGRGIATCHVWRLTVEPVTSWEILYDFSTGVAIVHGGFVGSRQVYTKGDGQLLKLWSLQDGARTDVPHSRDAVALVAGLVVGGQYALRVSRAGTILEELQLPLRTTRRRAAPNTVASVAFASGCDDCVVLCSDGAVASYDCARHELVEIDGIDGCVAAAVVPVRAGGALAVLVVWDANSKRAHCVNRVLKSGTDQAFPIYDADVSPLDVSHKLAVSQKRRASTPSHRRPLVDRINGQKASSAQPTAKKRVRFDTTALRGSAKSSKSGRAAPPLPALQDSSMSEAAPGVQQVTVAHVPSPVPLHKSQPQTHARHASPAPLHKPQPQTHARHASPAPLPKPQPQTHARHASPAPLHKSQPHAPMQSIVDTPAPVARRPQLAVHSMLPYLYLLRPTTTPSKQAPCDPAASQLTRAQATNNSEIIDLTRTRLALEADVRRSLMPFGLN